MWICQTNIQTNVFCNGVTQEVYPKYASDVKVLWICQTNIQTNVFCNGVTQEMYPKYASDVSNASHCRRGDKTHVNTLEIVKIASYP